MRSLDISKFKPIKSRRKDEIGSLYISLNKMVEEIEEQKKEIKEREIRLSHFYDATTDGILLHEEEKIILVNSALSEITGFTEEELMQLNAHSLYVAKNIGRKEAINIYESIAFRKNKKPIQAEIQHNIIEYEGKKIDVCLIRDISQRKEAQLALQQTEERFHLLIETLNEGILEIDEKNKITYANPKISEILGFENEKIEGKEISEFIADEEKQKFKFILKNALDKQKDEMQLRLVKKDGQSIFTRFAINPVFDQRNNYNGLIAAVSDITEQVLARESLQKSEEQLYAVFNYSPVMKFLINQNFSVLTMNKAALDISKKRIEKTLGGLFDCVHALNSTYGCGHTFHCKNCKIRNAIKYTFKTNQGISKLEAKLSRIINGSQETSYFLLSTVLLGSLEEPILMLSLDDITDRKLNEKKLLSATIEVEEAERKRFAQDLHDELGPFLSGIKLFVSKVGDESMSTDERLMIISELEDLIDDAIQKTRAISNKLLPSVLEDFGLTGGLDSFIKKINASSNMKIEFKAQDVFNAIEYELQVILYRIIIELINNSLKHAEAEECKIKFQQIDEKLQVSYSDNGKGFNFDQVLKEKKGIGLLNIINRLKNIDADYKVSTFPGKGFLFEFEIPYSAKNN